MKALLSVACGLGAVALLTPARPAAADDEKSPTGAELRLAMNNLKQIGLAFHNFADSRGGPFPNNVSAPGGKPLLSWRVQLLPYLGKDEAVLYKQFKLDEAWDGPTNMPLVAKLPKVYAPVRGKAKAGETFYQVFSGEKAVFGPKNSPRIPSSFLDGTSNTGLVYEAGEPVVWTSPADLPFDAAKPLPKLGGMFDGRFHVLLCDGSVIRCKKDPDVKELKKLIMPADGEVLDLNALIK